MRPVAATALGVLALIPAPVSAQEVSSASDTCAAFTWTTLGTAGGPVPTLDRAEPANLLRAGDMRVLVDAGDGTVNNLARVGVDLSQVRAVFISHHHLDHYGGLLAVIGLAWMTSYPGQMTIYGPPGTEELVRGLTAAMGPQARVGYGVGAPTPPEELVRVIELADGATARIGDIQVTASANSHFSAGEGSTAGDAVSLSYRFDFDGRSVTYTGDTGPSDAVAELANESDLLVSEVMDYERLIASMRTVRPNMPEAVFQPMALHIRTHHVSGEQVGQIAHRAKAGQVVLTHFATPPGPLSVSADTILSGVRQQYQGPVHFARDLASYDVGCRPASE